MSRRFVSVLVLAVALLGGSLAPLVSADSPHERVQVVVGFHGAPNDQAVESSGGRIVRHLEGLDAVVVSVPDVAAFRSALQHRPDVAFIQIDQRLVLDATGWSATRWDATRWDATRWDATRWDAAQWDATRWDATRWDATRWDATRWDAAQWDATRWDATRWDATRWDATRWDAAWGMEDPLLGYQWGLSAIEAPGAWNVTRGSQGVKLCVLDTGIDPTHPDLAGATLLDALVPNGSGLDEVGHGTHVAGIAAARGGDGFGVSGVANVSLLSVRVLNATRGSESDLAAGLMMCIDHGADIASISLHTTEASPLLDDAIAMAQASGMLIVASAGNDPTQVTYPGSAAGVLAVGAADGNGTTANFSGRGAALDILAPGVDILSTYPGDYALGTGTSQATPFVAGAAALVWSANASLSASQVSAILLSTAKDQGPAGWDGDTGAGLLDAFAAAAAAT